LVLFSVALHLPYKIYKYIDSLLKNEAWPRFALAAELDYSVRTLLAAPALMVCLRYHLAERFQRELSVNWDLSGLTPDLPAMIGSSFVI